MVSPWREELVKDVQAIKLYDETATYESIVPRLKEKYDRFVNSENGLTKNVISAAFRDVDVHRANHKLISFDGTDFQIELPRYDHPPHIYANSPIDVVFVRGDHHLPYIHKAFNDAMLAHMRWYKRRGYRVISVDVGDYADNGAMSRHPKLKAQVAMNVMKEAARAALASESKVVDEWYLLRGNHDDWFARYLDGVLSMTDYWEYLLGAIDKDKIKTIDSTKAVLHNCGTDWRLTHMYEYSKIPGRKVNTIAQKHDMNTITFHEHSLNVSRDNWNRLDVIACGMMANRALLEYVNDYDNTHNVMKNSYVVLVNGTFQMMTPYRAWQDWSLFDIDPLPMYEEEAQQQQVMTGKLDLMQWIEELAA